MILVVSDLHLGREPDRDAAILSDLADCVRVVRPQSVIFLGDVFDAFLETPGHLPAPAEAWARYVRTWMAGGIEIRYLMGNHDRWHRTWVTELTGNAPRKGHLDLDLGGHTVRLEHGDAGEPHGPATRFARWFSDQRMVYRLFTLVLPFGAAQALAAHVSRKAGNPASSPATARSLEAYARRQLDEDALDGILLGHAHRAGVVRSDAGKWYVNTGNWYLDRTFAILGPTDVQLCEWREGDVQTLESAAFDG